MSDKIKRASNILLSHLTSQDGIIPDGAGAPWGLPLSGSRSGLVLPPRGRRGDSPYCSEEGTGGVLFPWRAMGTRSNMCNRQY
jgi:hypothetical protein